MKVLRGTNIPPIVTGFARGLVEAALMAGVVFAVAWVTSASAPLALQMWAPLFIVGGRTLEGAIDHIDPTKQRAPMSALVSGTIETLSAMGPAVQISGEQADAGSPLPPCRIRPADRPTAVAVRRLDVGQKLDLVPRMLARIIEKEHIIMADLSADAQAIADAIAAEDAVIAAAITELQSNPDNAAIAASLEASLQRIKDSTASLMTAETPAATDTPPADTTGDTGTPPSAP